MRLFVSVSQYKCQLTSLFRWEKKKHKLIIEKKKNLARQLLCQSNKRDEQPKKGKSHETNLLLLQCCTVPTLWMHCIDVL